MKFEIVESTSRYDFERELERLVKKIENNEQEIIDIKYGGIGFLSNNWGGAYYYNAMIIYK